MSPKIIRRFNWQGQQRVYPDDDPTFPRELLASVVDGEADEQRAYRLTVLVYTSMADLEAKVRMLDAGLLAVTVERDNLQKMSADWQQKAQHNYEVAEQYRKNFELAIAERDLERHQKEMRHEAYLEAKRMLDAANDREEALIQMLGEFKRRWPLVFDELAREKPTPMCQDPVEGPEGRPT